MSRWFNRLHKEPATYAPPAGPPPSVDHPPGWSAAAEPSHEWGLRQEASQTDYEAAEAFCSQYPLEPPRLLDSHVVDQIRDEKAAAWHIEVPTSRRLKGSVSYVSGMSHIETTKNCEDCCLLSNIPIISGHYSRHGQTGVYYEISVNRMDPDAVVVLGSACRPYPQWRLPGWNRLSAGLHLDDMRKFFEDPRGGRDYTGSQGYLQRLQPGDTFGFGYEFASGEIFFTRNGARLPPAFHGEYMQTRLDRPGPDVYAAIGVCGRTGVRVNFGAEPFCWKVANTTPWRVEQHVGIMGMSGAAAVQDELPAYTAS